MIYGTNHSYMMLTDLFESNCGYLRGLLDEEWIRIFMIMHDLSVFFLNMIFWIELGGL